MNNGLSGFSRTAWRACVVVVGVLLWCPPAVASDALLLRLFLKDGSAIVSYGEYARVGERVIFSLPLGVIDENPKLHVATIPASTVDWTRTEEYAASARYDRYVGTRAEADFNQMSAAVADALNRIGITGEPAARLRLAEEARRQLVEWPAANFGYRAADVRQYVGLLDEIIHDLRAATGDQRVDVNLVAISDPPVAVPLLAAPSLKETIEQSLSVARLTTVPAERLSLLQSAITIIDGLANTAPWAKSVRQRAAGVLSKELHVERAYSELSSSSLRTAAEKAARADVRGVEKVTKTVLERDKALGRQRPDEVQALIATLTVKLDAARRFRLERDRYESRAGAYRRYQDQLQRIMAQFVRSAPLLEEIKALAGPDRSALAPFQQQLTSTLKELGVVSPPTELITVHSVLTSALHMADQAARLRDEAVVSADLAVAWRASSAAAAALMLFSRGREELDSFLQPPEFR